MRATQQSKARSDAFTNLGPSNSLWIRDYAQKYNPTKTLESMNEYFGKRGLTVSVEVFIWKVLSTYHKQVYLVTLDRCDQDSLETLCIVDKVLEQFNKDYPYIRKIQLKSDNAGNYHANGVPESMYQLAQKYGISLSEYNYNEAQCGKDQCDREAALLKRCAEKWLLRKDTNKISNAKELLEAVFSNGGPKNTKIVKFQDTTGAKYKEFYEIGEGNFHEYSGVHFVNGATLFVDWKESVRQDNSMMYDIRSQREIFECPETLCICEFRSESEMMNHLASGSHQYANTKNRMDDVILYYAQQKHMQNAMTEAAMIDNVIDVNDVDDFAISNYSRIYTHGWARKVRKVKKITTKQKQFIQTLFEKGAASNVKLSADQMAQRIKDEMINGVYYFRPEKYLELRRIRNLISGLKIPINKPVCKIIDMSEHEGIECNIDDICDSFFYPDI